MEATITKVFRFEAAHQLPNHDGKCRNPHGHSYKVAVRVTGPINHHKGHPKEGMVIDFADIKDIWDAKLKPKLDHRNLNEVFNFTTTAENLSIWIAKQLKENGIPIQEVEVWETETSSAKVTNSALVRYLEAEKFQSLRSLDQPSKVRA